MTRTKSEQARFDNMKDLGCIACILDKRIEPFGFGYAPEIHHMDGRVKPDSELKTVPLCTWHHQGTSNWMIETKWILKDYGPSWHKHRRAFRERYGSDAELIETVNKYLEPSE